MGWLVDDKSWQEMRRWIDIVEDYNKKALGTESPYEVVGVGLDNSGTLTLKLRPKK